LKKNGIWRHFSVGFHKKEKWKMEGVEILGFDGFKRPMEPEVKIGWKWGEAEGLGIEN
jgi:hypothetical protein